jgi:hypothetical protein
MPHQTQPPSSTRTKERQLALPFTEPMATRPTNPPVVVPTIRPPCLWGSLSATTRNRVRQQLLQVVQEVLNDARPSR